MNNLLPFLGKLARFHFFFWPCIIWIFTFDLFNPLTSEPTWPVFPLRPYGAQLAQRVRELAQSFLKGKNKKEVFLLRTWDGISNSEILSNHHALKVDHHNQTIGGPRVHEFPATTTSTRWQFSYRSYLAFDESLTQPSLVCFILHKHEDGLLSSIQD